MEFASGEEVSFFRRKELSEKVERKFSCDSKEGKRKKRAKKFRKFLEFQVGYSAAQFAKKGLPPG